MIRIFGTMTDPSGSPVPGAIIELRAINSTSEVLLGSTVNHKCDQQGAYSFQLAIGTYDAYAQNDRCGDMDYLGTASVSANSVDGDLHSILVDGGINITPPMLEGALAAAQRAESAAALTAADRVSTGQNAESAKADSAAAKTAKDEAISAASTAISARDSIVTDANDVRRLATQIADQAADVSSKHGDVTDKSWQVADQAADVSSKHGDVVSLAEQVSSDASATQSAKNAAVSASSNAQSSATSAAGDAAKAEAAAVKAEQAAQTVVGALIDAGPYNASTGVLPTPVMSGATKLSSVWKVTGNGTAGGIDLGVGDSLVYTARDNSYYKIDNTESVTKVNNKTGAVTLTAADVAALSLENGGTVRGDVNVPSLVAGDDLYSVRLINAGQYTYVQGGKRDSDTTDQKLVMSGWYGTPLSFLRFLMADNATPCVTQGGVDYKIFHKNFKPTADDVEAEPAGAISTHESKAGAHQISGVAGLREALDAKYSPGNIVGNVSQSGGVPTGAIVQRGSNANGEFVRFADGTQICSRGTVQSSSVAAVVWDFPAQFIDAPSVPAQWAYQGSVALTYNLFDTSTTSVSFEARLASNNARSASGYMKPVAFGRWY